MIKKTLVILSLLFVCVFSSLNNTLADVGNFHDYSSGGGWDSGGSSSHSSSRSSSSYDDDDDDRRYYSSSSSSGRYRGGGGSSSFSTFDAMVFIAIMAVFLFISYSKAKNSKNKNNNRSNEAMPQNAPSAVNLADNSIAITQAITEIDPEFSSMKFIAWSKEVFITLQQAWTERDWEKVRPFEKEELYKQHETQIKDYIDRGWVNVLERININNAYLYRYERDKEYEYLSVYIQSRMTDYIKDENTGSVIKGNPNVDSYGKYLYTFMRKKGVLSAAVKTENSIVECPNCGAPTKITSAGKCEYCNFIVTTGEYSWVLSDIEGVKSYSSVKPGGIFINE